MFEVAVGDQLSHRGYQYIKGKPLSEHHYNCGMIIGEMHNASETYVQHQGMKRHDILAYIKKMIQDYLPDHLIKVRKKSFSTSLIKPINTGTFFAGSTCR